ncbi:cutinase [Thraustotheca clavata]|uniref:Cutinase n=1 Tax=Thraustotheca clavata TaxID=74557 RepID=A0A1V9YHW4_9STRA|nr:cutinase [Thraustotheca clavata]
MVSILSSIFALALYSKAVNAANCTDVHIVFARGSGEPAGFGICGEPLVSGIKNHLPGMSVSSYAVNYTANYLQTSAGDGATDMTNHLVQVAKDCPRTSFVIGGYSQGATATDIAIGIKTDLGTGEIIPTNLAPRIKAVVTFGNPLQLYGQTLAEACSLYAAKSIEFCNDGDPVCANGIDVFAHLAYPKDGTVAKAAEQAAAKVKGTSSPKSFHLRVAPKS